MIFLGIDRHLQEHHRGAAKHQHPTRHQQQGSPTSPRSEQWQGSVAI
jgi:hypothetical protein